MKEQLLQMGFTSEEIVMMLENPVTAILLKVTELPMEMQVALKETLLKH